jgi:hypothetical protein
MQKTKRKQRKVEKKGGKLGKNAKKEKEKRNALWITVVIHSDFGVGEQ